MLKTRIITALLLLLAIIPSLFWMPQMAWAMFIAVFAGLGAWEWGGLMRASPRARIGGGVLTCLFSLLYLYLLPQSLGVGASFSPQDGLAVYVLAMVFWLVLVPFWMYRKWRLASGLVGWLIGLAVLFPTWLALVQLRMLGAWPLLAIFAVVWVADIAAYFFGRLFGKHKLAIAISPGKTWEGAVGGGGTVLAYGLLMRHYFALDETPLWIWIIALLAVTVVSVVGDLFESLLKRQVGLKDSSQLLPGHGGILDRIDSLTSTLPLVALLWLLMAR